MSEDSKSSQNLSIRCPACRQRFNVDDELMNRMVECGGCDTRFRINEDVIIRTKKFYPGERASPELQRFQRVPMSSAPPPKGLQPMRYDDFDNPEKLGPISPQRIIAGIFGVATMIVVALLLLFSSSPNASFAVMPLENKLIIAGFVSLLGLILLIYANPNARIKATLVGLLFSAGLISIPFFVKGTPPQEISGDIPPGDEIVEPVFPTEEVDPIDLLRERFSTKPLEKERARLGEAGSERNAFGVYITKMVERNKYTARDYLIREAGAELSSHLYPRDNDNYLMILTGVTQSIDQIADIAGKLGKTEEIHPEIGVIVVSVDNDQFLAGSADKLNDRSDPAFYDLNQRELESIDLDRVKRAVERLADSEASIFRDDITKTLNGLMIKPGVTFHDSIARALLVWAEDPAQASESGLKALNQYVDKGLAAPEDLVALVAAGADASAIPTVVKLWKENPVLWDKYLVKFGSSAEPPVLEQIDSESAPLGRSAASVLAQIGTKTSLPALREALEKDDPELQVLAERAIRSIEER